MTFSQCGPLTGGWRKDLATLYGVAPQEEYAAELKGADLSPEGLGKGIPGEGTARGRPGRGSISRNWLEARAPPTVNQEESGMS